MHDFVISRDYALNFVERAHDVPGHASRLKEYPNAIPSLLDAGGCSVAPFVALSWASWNALPMVTTVEVNSNVCPSVRRPKLTNCRIVSGSVLSALNSFLQGVSVAVSHVLAIVGKPSVRLSVCPSHAGTE